ncbi:kinase-like protein [Backusella circina FSU 941]|nr:kinase-like protein [Backusella circina FSU 941]
MTTGNVMIVHPVGNYYSMDEPLPFDGWVKVKVVRSTRFKSILPGYFLDDLMDQPGTLKRVVLPKTSNDLTTARNNEIIRRFISNITASRTDTIQLYPTPIQCVDSLIPHADSLLIPDPENQSASKSSVEVSWQKLKQFCNEKFAKVVSISDYSDHINQPFHARGHFKRIFFIDNNKKTLQLFYKYTTSQKVTELASYLALKSTDCIGNMTEMIVDKDGQAMGLVMDKYDMTLHSYIKKGVVLTGERKYELVLQMWKSLVTIHRRGIAHRDLSAHNFMIKQMEDKSVKLYLIDFGKAVFFRSKDAQHWWVDSDESHVYQDELRPTDEEELFIWCKSLPYLMSKPDHGHLLLRSIQTLPKNSGDHITLPYLIDPVAEDVYSLGVVTWNLFSGKMPWPGVFDSDLKQIRNTVISPAEIDRLIRREVPGPLSKYILSACLKVNPLERQTAEQILGWLECPSNKQSIINEWDLHYSSISRRHR